MQTKAFFRVAGLTLVSLALTFQAQAAKSKKSSDGDTGMVRAQTAAQAWNAKPKKDETTASMEKRLRKEVRELLAKDTSKLDPDSSYWKLLKYLRELPWESVSPRWQQWYLQKQPNPKLTDTQRAALVKTLEKKPLYKMTPKEVDVYLGLAQQKYPDFRERVMHLARKNIGQPYMIYLLGEFPYEVYDTEPLYCLTNSDCVVFSEHTYAMALSSDWTEFFKNLQKLRYKDGEVGMVTRNHFTEADWDKNNAWLIKDITNDVGATTVTQYKERIDRAAFFANFGIGQDTPVEMLEDTYIPADAVESVLPKLRDGDFVNVVRGRGAGVWVGHVGMIGHKPDGTVTFIHSTEPKVKEQPIMEYVKTNVKKNVQKRKEGKAEFMGFKFLALRDDVIGTTGTKTVAAE